MLAAIDVGSNTIRMLIGSYCDGSIVCPSYNRHMVRLAGDYSDKAGLSVDAMGRALTVLKTYQDIIQSNNVATVKIVGTAALRRAVNQQSFLQQVYASTGFEIDVIDGAQEALLTTTGVLSVVQSGSENLLVIDIGGGSTEITAVIAGEVCLHVSYPLGVVRLSEEYPTSIERQSQIDLVIEQFALELSRHGLVLDTFELIGTAGTITTLAAINLNLDKYDSELINNHLLSYGWLIGIEQKLKLLSMRQRECIAGMEAGRGDLILPGLQILLAFMDLTQVTRVRVADSGLLEGVFLRQAMDL